MRTGNVLFDNYNLKYLNNSLFIQSLLMAHFDILSASIAVNGKSIRVCIKEKFVNHTIMRKLCHEHYVFHMT